jgi:XRE family aerobic/anaerobic benzoate catabolism transcriptional regulator
MNDLRSILAGRTAFYSKADVLVDTSRQDLSSTFDVLNQKVRQLLRLEQVT